MKFDTRVGVKSAYITAIATIIVAIITGIFLRYKSKSDANGAVKKEIEQYNQEGDNVGGDKIIYQSTDKGDTLTHQNEDSY